MKSILIIDTPTICYDCPLYTSIADEVGLPSEYGFCDDRNILKLKEAQEKIRFNQKPKWCPLKPMPEKDEEPEDDLTDYVQQDYDRMASYFYGLINGRNNVINEILGETE